jgi:hypothetical protein
MAGQPRKAAEARKSTRRYETTTLVAVQAIDAVVPVLADASGMLAVTREAWAAFWSSPLRDVVVPGSDLPALTRMFHLQDEYERCRREFRTNRLTPGSSGQPVVNPLGSFMLALAKEIRALEDRFGASVVSRLRLSVELGAATKSLDEMNRSMAAGSPSVVVDPLAT